MWVQRVALVTFVLGACMLATGVCCVVFTPYCPYAAGMPSCPINKHICNIEGAIGGAFVVINSIVGVAASMRNSQNLFIAHLVMSVLCILAAAALGATEYLFNFEPIGALPLNA